MRSSGIRIPGVLSAILFSCLIFVAACHVQLVSDYDPEFVANAVEVQKEIDTLLQGQRNPVRGADLSYEASKPAYNKIEVDLSSLLARAQSHPDNDPTINQVKSLIETVHGLERIHQRDDHLPRAVIDIEQDTIRRDVSSIVRTENDKKTGQ